MAVAAPAGSVPSRSTLRDSGPPDRSVLYDGWRWIETKGALPNDCKDPVRCGRDRILRLRPDNTYELVEQDTAFEYPLCAGTFTILRGAAAEHAPPFESHRFKVAFAMWWRWFEEVQVVRFAGRDTLVTSGFAVVNAPTHWFVRDRKIGVAKKARSPARVARKPASPDSGSGITPAEGEFVYYEEAPIPVSKPELVYPDDAREAKIEGRVVLHVLVGKDGRVKNVKVARGVVGLNDAAMDFARGWIFKPALAGGRPVAVWVELPADFRL